MRCDDVIRELAAPSGSSPAAEISEHLGHCPGCAAWAGRDAALGRAWEATRPEEPSPLVWDEVWAGVTEALERSPAPARTGRRSALLLFGLAQAAAILVAVLAAWPRPEPPAIEVARNPTAAPAATVDIDEGQLVVIRADGPVIRAESLALQENAGGIDANFELFNTLESMAQ